MKDRTSFWWAFSGHDNLMFYGTGDSPAEHHQGHSTKVVKVVHDSDPDLLQATTESGSVYLIRQSRMYPNIHVAVRLSYFLGDPWE